MRTVKRRAVLVGEMPDRRSACGSDGADKAEQPSRRARAGVVMGGFGQNEDERRPKRAERCEEQGSQQSRLAQDRVAAAPAPAWSASAPARTRGRRAVSCGKQTRTKSAVTSHGRCGDPVHGAPAE